MVKQVNCLPASFAGGQCHALYVIVGLMFMLSGQSLNNQHQLAGHVVGELFMFMYVGRLWCAGNS